METEEEEVPWGEGDEDMSEGVNRRLAKKPRKQKEGL